LKSTDRKLKRTPFYSQLVALGGKMVPFAGWEMPLQFEGIVAEHLCVRSKVGVFDVSHMGEIEVRGERAGAFVDQMITNDASRLEQGEVLYSPVCYQDGGIVDDVLVYRLSWGFLIVVNAANSEKDFVWLKEWAKGVEVVNKSDEIGQLAIQGPDSEDLVASFLGDGVRELKYYHCTELERYGKAIIVSRTGYTGEDGFEIYCPRDNCSQLWDELQAAGKSLGLKPIGLGARDSLRLEMCYCLYGNDIDETKTPLEAGLGWAVKLEKENFVGKSALTKQKELGVKKKLVAMDSPRGRVPRHGCPILKGGERIGVVTSGGFSPSLGKPVSMGYVDAKHSRRGEEVEIDVGGRTIAARIVKKPLYREGSHR